MYTHGTCAICTWCICIAFECGKHLSPNRSWSLEVVVGFFVCPEGLGLSLVTVLAHTPPVRLGHFFNSEGFKCTLNSHKGDMQSHCGVGARTNERRKLEMSVTWQVSKGWRNQRVSAVSRCVWVTNVRELVKKRVCERVSVCDKGECPVSVESTFSVSIMPCHQWDWVFCRSKWKPHTFTIFLCKVGYVKYLLDEEFI